MLTARILNRVRRMSDPDLAAIISGNVRAYRAKRSWKQRQLGERMGVSAATVSNTETGVRHIYANDLIPLCRALEVPLVKLFDGLPDEDLRTLGLL